MKGKNVGEKNDYFRQTVEVLDARKDSYQQN
jgi:hypothetical protein